MLRPPYTTYEHLYVYHLDMPTVPDITDPDLIGTWIEDGSAILFFHKKKEALVQNICNATGSNIIYQADLSYEDWEAGQKIEPFNIGNLSISPVWENISADIKLDPSVIFGSGFHPSTRLCLEAMLKYINTPEIEINSALDLGCGTGLLSIAAAKQGVKQITAVDHNPLACEVAQQNVILNEVQGNINVQQADLRTGMPDTQVDLVIANLYRELLEQLLKTPSFWQASYYIIAGFIPGMEEGLLASLPHDKVKLLERRRKDRWCLWVLGKL